MSQKAVLGFLAGAAVGAIAGILFAPDKGASTRKKILKKGEDLGASLKESFNDFVDSAKSMYSSAKDEGEEAVEKGKSKMNTLKQDAKNALS
jgi:gas vesicle protein